jgi:hypothetical protein
MELSIVLTVGLMLAWVGERIVESPTARGLLTGLGSVLVVVAFATRALRAGQASGTRAVQRSLAALHGVAVLGLACYALQSDLFTKATGASLESSSPKLAGALAVLWPALMLVSLVPTLLVELSFSAMAKSPRLEDGRIQEALYAGLGVAFTFVFAASVQYVATERDAKADFSYFRTAKPGDATKKLVASIDEKVEVFLFYPPGSDAADLVAGYFDELKENAPLLSVTRLDYALEPVKSKELGVSSNGTVVVRKGARKESLYVGTETEKSKTALRGLDGDVQKKLLLVARSKRTIYLTAGHGERTQDPIGGTDQRATISILWKALQGQNFELRLLSAAEGLGQEVPKDAAAVFVLGPTRTFTEPEASALAQYGKRGGRLFVALDPEAGLAFEELVKPLGLTFLPQLLAQERGTANLRPPPSLADRTNIGTRTFSSHPAVTELGRANAAVLFVGAGGLEEATQHPADLVIDLAVRSIPEAWNDANHDFQFQLDKQETKKSWGLMAAVTRRAPSNKPDEELRALVLSDSDGIGDEVLPLLQGNQYLVLDGLKWLLNDDALAGTTNTELDVPLTRTRQMDLAWFYGTTFAAPLAVVGLGFLARRRTRKPEVKS